MKRINSMVWGTVLLLIGIVLTMNELKWINISGDITMPIILLGLSVVFHLYYFLSNGRNEGLLVPGGILLVYGLLFLGVNQFGSIFSIGTLWPLFILGPALGLFELYLFSRGTKGSLIPVFILTIIGGGFLLNNIGIASFGVILAIILICVGIAMMISALLKGSFKSGYKPIDVKPEPEQKSYNTEETPK
jgi:hypothetical protein